MSPAADGWIRTVAMIAVLILFLARYHVVLPSDDVLEVQAIRKEHLGLSEPVVVVPTWVQRYNSASPVERRKMDDSYIVRRLLETGMVVRR